VACCPNRALCCILEWEDDSPAMQPALREVSMARAVKKAFSTPTLHDLTQQFKILAEPSRLIVLGILAKTERNVGALADDVGMSESTISQHLSLLRAAEFVENRRDGSQSIYTLTALGRVFWQTAEKLLT
jgi:DNA-binding transcriptional ArsR family regulator